MFVVIALVNPIKSAWQVWLATIPRNCCPTFQRQRNCLLSISMTAARLNVLFLCCNHNHNQMLLRWRSQYSTSALMRSRTTRTRKRTMRVKCIAVIIMLSQQTAMMMTTLFLCNAIAIKQVFRFLIKQRRSVAISIQTPMQTNHIETI